MIAILLLITLIITFYFNLIKIGKMINETEKM